MLGQMWVDDRIGVFGMESSEGADDTMARSNDTIAAWFVGAWLVSAIGAAALFLVGTWRAYSTIGPEEGVVAEVGIGFPFGLSWDFSASNADLSLLVAAAAGALGALTYAARGLALRSPCAPHVPGSA